MTQILWPELYFIRHGETDWNAEKRYQGQKDVPLNEKGRGQADRNGQILRRLFERRGIDPMALEWHTSPLGRARETMTRIRAAFPENLPPAETDPRLKEISFGRLEGLLHSELPAHMALAPGAREAGYWAYRPEGGENYHDVEARLNAFAGKLGGPAVIVSHGGIARALRVLVEEAAIGDVINWSPRQDVVMHLRRGEMETIGAGDV